jgi:hypothetical protein
MIWQAPHGLIILLQLKGWIFNSLTANGLPRYPRNRGLTKNRFCPAQWALAHDHKPQKICVV